MYGYRERIGLILPSSNTAMESEFFRTCPEGVSVHTTRVLIKGLTNPECLAEMASHAERAAEELKTCLSDVMIYGCTSGSFLKGRAWEKQFCERLQQLAERPVLTTADNCVQALRAIGKRKIAIGTPYIESLNRSAYQYFTEAGFEIVHMKGLGIEVSTNIGKTAPHAIYRLGREAMAPDAEALFLSCTGIRSIEIVQQPQDDLGIPVISSNLCNLWAALRMHGLHDRLEGLGDLFSYDLP